MHQQFNDGRRISITSKNSVLSSSTSTDLLSTVNAVGINGNGGNNESESDNAKSKWWSFPRFLNWKSYVLLSVIDSVHMLFVFLPIGVLPANLVMVVPLIGISIFSLFNCCISCDDTYIRLGWDNMTGCALLFLSIFLLLFQDKESVSFMQENEKHYDKKYISNLILFFVGCVLMIFNDIYKRIALSKVKIDMLEFNLIESVLSMVWLWVLSPLAFQIQYIRYLFTLLQCLFFGH